MIITFKDITNPVSSYPAGDFKIRTFYEGSL
jgi:hypothetical protein